MGDRGVMERPEESTKLQRVCSKRTICEVHRQIKDLVFFDGDKKEILALVDEAFEMGVAMTKKLVEYKCSLPDWKKNTNKEEIARIRKLRLELERHDNG